MNAICPTAPDHPHLPLRQRLAALLYPALLPANLAGIGSIFLHTRDPRHLALGLTPLSLLLTALV